jgi:hypothetical protein
MGVRGIPEFMKKPNLLRSIFQAPAKVKNPPFLAPFTFAIAFSAKCKLVARKQGRCAEKASAQLFRIVDCGFRISFAIFSNPHSAIHNPQLHEVLSLSIRNPQSAIRNWEMGFSIDPRGRMC